MTAQSTPAESSWSWTDVVGLLAIIAVSIAYLVSGLSDIDPRAVLGLLFLLAVINTWEHRRLHSRIAELTNRSKAGG